jgi:hypothetical protein
MAGEQDRSRTDPFAGQPPDTARDYSRAPSDLSTAPPADRARPLDGQQAWYRLAFVAMEIRLFSGFRGWLSRGSMTARRSLSTVPAV